MITIREAHDLRDALFTRLLADDDRDYSEYAAQHDVWPCLTGTMRVLTADLRWTPISEIEVGAEIIAFDEHGTHHAPRRWRLATVTAISNKRAKADRYTFDDGSAIEATPDHRVLSGEEWAPIGNTKRVRRLIEVWDNSATWERGYLAGVFDGEGSLGRYSYTPRSTSTRLTFVQTENGLLDRALRYLEAERFSYRLKWRGPTTRLGTKPIAEVEITGGVPEILRFLGQVRPERLKATYTKILDQTLQSRRLVKVATESLGEQTVYDLETTTGTFIAEGFAVHNCVRKGAGERWLAARGETFKPSRSAALYFLRGKSAEAIMSRGAGVQEMTVLNGVASHPDLSRADLEALFGAQTMRVVYPNVRFAEIKSTNYSSFEFYKLVQQGKVELALNKAFKMRNYFEQSANYATALNADAGLLIVFFLHGDYADRRSKCPQCGNALGDWVDDFYRECVACGYKTKRLDLWVYELTFDAAERERVRADVFGVRADQFRAAQLADDEASLMERAPGTPNHYCASCKVGKRLGCEYAGKVYD